MQRINLKSKRKRTVIKKVIEFSQLFDLDILMIIHDKEMHKVFEYNSGSQQTGFFSFDHADQIRKQALQGKSLYKPLTNENYDKLLRNGDRGDPDDEPEGADEVMPSSSSSRMMTQRGGVASQAKGGALAQNVLGAPSANLPALKSVKSAAPKISLNGSGLDQA